MWAASGIDPEKSPVVSIVGAGGKTSLIKHLSHELSKRKIFHYIATTTKMWPMDAGVFTKQLDNCTVASYAKQIGPLDKNGKVCSLSEDEWKQIFAKGCPVLIEADGSKGLPCKVPESHEPVFRKETTHVFGVLGMSCLNGKVKDICHRPRKVMELLNCGEEHLLSVEDIEKIMMSSQGLRKSVEEYWSYQVILNQVDDPQTFEQIKHLEEHLREKAGCQVWFTRMLEEKTDKDNGDVV